MAGYWIKFDTSTPDKPEVWAIADQLAIDPDAVVGKLLRVWAWFDDHTEKGNAPSVTKSLLDRRVGVSGFCEAMILAGWMTQVDGVLTIPNFDRHNGATAKSRCLTAKRVAKHKTCVTKSNAQGNAASVSSALPRADTDTEENKSIAPASKKREKPSVEEIRDYCRERRSGVNPDQFFDYYEANGWTQGKGKPIRDWQAAVRTWERNGVNQTTQAKPLQKFGANP